MPPAGRLSGKEEWFGEYDQCKNDVKGKLYYGVNNSMELQTKYTLIRFGGRRPDIGTPDSFLVAHCATSGCAAMFEATKYRTSYFLTYDHKKILYDF